jgi:cell division protein FtsB
MQLTRDSNLNNLTPDPRFVYNGKDGPLPSDVMVRKNRPIQKNRPPFFKTTLLIFCLIIFGVIAIKNIITVDRLANEINQYRNRYSILTSKIELLRAEINKKSGIDRITQLARKELNMVDSKNQTVWFVIDETNIKANTGQSN